MGSSTVKFGGGGGDTQMYGEPTAHTVKKHKFMANPLHIESFSSTLLVGIEQTVSSGLVILFCCSSLGDRGRRN